jgi:hypothetical protein
MMGDECRWRCLRVVLWLFALLLAAPAVAIACPNVNRVQSFNGTVSLSYQRTVTASDGHGGTETLTLSHTATGVNVSIALVYSGKGPPYWQGSTSGGNVAIDDVLDDVSSDGTDTHGQQVANGPAEGGNVFGGLDFESASCTYAILAGAGIDTVTTGSGPHDPYGVGDEVMSGVQPLPANLVLSGSITVPAFVDLNASPVSAAPSGWYQFGENSSWGTAMGSLTGGVTGSVGPATFSWNLKPTFLAPVKPMCEVPDLVHDKLKAATRALRRAGCRLGKVTRRRSSRVAEGRVIATRPPAFTVHRLHTKVALTVSTGKKR